MQKKGNVKMRNIEDTIVFKISNYNVKYIDNFADA